MICTICLSLKHVAASCPLRPRKMPSWGTSALLFMLLAGCATTAPEQPVQVIDSYCLSPASKKRVWNPETDTIEQMRAAVTFNRYTDKRCGHP